MLSFEQVILLKGTITKDGYTRINLQSLGRIVVPFRNKHWSLRANRRLMDEKLMDEFCHDVQRATKMCKSQEPLLPMGT